MTPEQRKSFLLSINNSDRYIMPEQVYLDEATPDSPEEIGLRTGIWTTDSRNSNYQEYVHAGVYDALVEERDSLLIQIESLKAQELEVYKFIDAMTAKLNATLGVKS